MQSRYMGCKNALFRRTFEQKTENASEIAFQMLKSEHANVPIIIDIINITFIIIAIIIIITMHTK